MTGRFATLAVALTLSASVAYAGQARQRFPGGSGQSSGSQSSGQSSSGQSSGGASSGQSSGGQATPRSAPPAAAPRSAPPAAAPATPPPTRSGSQLQRWGAPRNDSTPASTPTPPSATPRPESTLRSVFERLGAPRSEPTPQPTGRSTETQLQRWGNPRTETPDNGASPLQSAQPAQPSQPARAAVPRIRSAPLTTTPSTTVVDDGAVSSSQRVAEPRRYPNPENATTRVAVPRGSVPSVVDPRPSGGGTIVYDRGARVYRNYYYYSRHSYPYGYGSYGLGYFYYDPYGWYDPYPVYYPGPTYTGGYYDPRYGYGTGEIRLQVRPRDADVYVDGFYAGRVDEFDGFVQSLRIEEGPHTIEIVAPGYEPLVFSVRIVAGRKINYRRDLIPYRR